MQLPEFVYNTILQLNAERNGLQYTPKYEFNDLDVPQKEFYEKCRDVAKILEFYNKVNPEYYLRAPFILTPPDKKRYFGAGHFLHARERLGDYNKLATSIWRDECDEKVSLELFEKSFPFIRSFCESKNLTLEQYVSGNAVNPWILQHVSRLFVSPYIIFCLPHGWNVCQNASPDIIDLTIGDLNALFSAYTNFAGKSHLISTAIAKFNEMRQQR